MYKTQPDYDFDTQPRLLHSSSSNPNDITLPENKEPERDISSQRPAPISERSQPGDESTEYNRRGERKASGVGTLPPAFVERGEVRGRAEMTTREVKFGDGEWETVIKEAEEKIHEAVREERKFGVPKNVAGTIDHTFLKLDATEQQVGKLCEEARGKGFATVCVRPDWVSLCISKLHETNIPVAAVIGFHEGTYTLEHKISEIDTSTKAGALELDVVLNYPDLIAKHYAKIYTELSTIRARGAAPVALKLILETSQLDSRQIVAACTIANAAGFDFVKTSTGFNGQGATVENVRLMRACCEVLAEGGRTMKVKASGGIRAFGDAVEMLEAGASRLGCSAGVAIAEEERGGKKAERGNEGY
ncbi:hypothetical protein DOTSEDRAFT_75463 [Dothistroma septosporum NZE10]|uniref:deoxyribose-phosphate aldolase n=1 Tax=Dothistroma septosporum (strain NZE10 / CBS 128990) TaxID=675120 RepID=M2Y068_DOTSN|nr:hypothetical protein DOTSEDRAFT_75463 [Dothistroma septosporum NZE10]